MRNIILIFIITIGCNYKSEQVGNKEKQDSLFLYNLFKEANNYYNSGEFEAFYKASKLIQKKATQLNDSANIAKANSYLGDYHRKKLNIDSAYVYYNHAQSIYTSIDDRLSVSEMLYNKALIYYNTGDFSRAQITALKSLVYIRGLNNNKEFYKIYNLLGIIFNELKEFDKAVEYHNKALNLIDGDLLFFKPQSLNNIGVVYRNQNKNKEAIYYFQIALKDKDLDKKTPFLFAMIVDNLAYSQFKLNNYSELPGLFYKALSIRNNINDVAGVVINKLHLSEFYQNQKDNKKAIRYAEEAYYLAKYEGTDVTDLLLCLKQLKSVNSANGVYYMSEYIKISDSLKSAEPKLANKLVQADFDKEDLVIQKEKLEKDKNKIIIWSVIMSSLLIITLLFRHSLAKNKELKLKEKQRVTDAYIHKADSEIYNLLLSRSERIKQQVDGIAIRASDKLKTELLSKIFEVRISLDVFNNRTDKLAMQDRARYIRELKNIEASIAGISEDLEIKKETDASFIGLLNELFDSSDLDIKFYIPNYEWQKIDSIIKVNLYRVIKESVSNIINHSKARELIGGIEIKENNLLLTIIDDGVGFNVDSVKKGTGLKNMRLSADKLRGLFDIKSSDKGTIVKLKISL